jgi:hypothetical protein
MAKEKKEKKVIDNEKNIIVNQPVPRNVYAPIKAIAALESKYIQDVVTDALVFYANSKGYKI